MSRCKHGITKEFCSICQKWEKRENAKKADHPAEKQAASKEKHQQG